MFCNKCGVLLEQGATFCYNCGAPAARSQGSAPSPAMTTNAPVVYPAPFPQYQTPVPAFVPQYRTRFADPNERSAAKSILVFGIIALAACDIPYLAFLGIIFGAIALSKAKKYTEQYAPLSGKTKVGRILGLVGLIVGIVATVGYALTLTSYIIAIIQYISSLTSTM